VIKANSGEVANLPGCYGQKCKYFKILLSVMKVALYQQAKVA